MRSDNERGVTVNGKHYTGYEATQRQREMERAIRKQKWKIAADEASGDSEKLQEDKTRLNLLRREYREFSKAAGLRQQSDRLFVAAGGGKGTAPKASGGEEPGSMLTSHSKGDIIGKTTPPEEKPDVHTVGHIDREIYRCVTEDIRTDEVIITDERIAHIKERHPGAYEEFSEYLRDIVEEPDFILPGNRKNTALILKEIASTGKTTKTVLWLSTPGDNPDYKNSIMTLVKTDEADWDRLLRNKKILYRRK